MNKDDTGRPLGDSGFEWKGSAGIRQFAVVFVHGWNGDALSTWTWTPRGLGRLRFWKRRDNVLLFDLLRKSKEFKCDIYSFAHSGGPFKTASIEDIASGFQGFVSKYVKNEHVILVGHSLGGLILRRAVLDWIEHTPDIADRIVGLLMLATPNAGTEIARFPRVSLTAKQMKPWDRFLANMNREWVDTVLNGGAPHRKPEECLIVPCRALVGELDRVVVPGSVGILNSSRDYGVISQKDHQTICKAGDTSDPAFQFVNDFVTECVDGVSNLKRARAAAHAASRVSHALLNEQNWIIEECYRITIHDEPSCIPESISPDLKPLLTCTSEIRRTVTEIPKKIKVGVRIKPHRFPKDLDLDYAISINQGLLDASRFSILSDFLKKRAQDDIESIKARCGESEEVEFKIEMKPELNPRAAWAVFEFFPTHEDLVGAPGEVTIVARRFIPKRLGVLGYSADRPIMDKLDASIEAPFEVETTHSFITETQEGDRGPAGKVFTSRIVVHGPIPARSWVAWYFREGPDYEQKQVEKKEEKEV